MASKKEDYSTAIAFNKSWLEFYWKSMARIEKLNKLSVTKYPSRIRSCNQWRVEENPRKDLFKSHEKLYKMIAASYKDERPCCWLLILWKMFNFSYCTNNFFFSSFVFLLIFYKVNQFFSKLSFIFLFCSL